MPKSSLPFVPAEYALVADRITLFYEKYPTGRITTKLVSRENREIVFRASIYRSADDQLPAATGWASEREDDGNEINEVACLENTETSAIGRALANLGFTASKRRPSYEEMQKTERVKARKASLANDARVAALDDLNSLLLEAQSEGVPEADLAAARRILDTREPSVSHVEIAERSLRALLDPARRA